MTKKNPRYLSILILNKIFNDKSYSNLVLKEYLEKYQDIYTEMGLNKSFNPVEN